MFNFSIIFSFISAIIWPNLTGHWVFSLSSSVPWVQGFWGAEWLVVDTGFKWLTCTLWSMKGGQLQALSVSCAPETQVLFHWLLPLQVCSSFLPKEAVRQEIEATEWRCLMGPHRPGAVWEGLLGNTFFWMLYSVQSKPISEPPGHLTDVDSTLFFKVCLTTGQFSAVQSLSHIRLFATPWIAACQASLSIANSQSAPKPMLIESVPSNHLILCHPLLFLPSIFPSIRVFSNESALLIRWPKYWSFSFNISPFNEHPGLISFRMYWLNLLSVQGTLKSLLQHHSSKASILRHSAFFIVQLSHP